ncbi:MAG: tetratricopeptide repeat protein [Chloroflexi bacterium]|nr:tetratricopeptide repeat protein [Chloroflexota bacterium]
MNLVERIAKWVGVDVSSVNRPEVVEFKTVMEAARAAKRAERFDEALAFFEKAAHSAEQLRDTQGMSVIRLHRADIYIRLGDLAEAQSLVNLVGNTLEPTVASAPRAYARVAQGVINLARGDDEGARAAFEEAQSIAQKARSPGAEGRAMGYLGSMYLSEGNASYAAHLLREALPRLNASGDLELSAYFITDLARALITSGDIQEADQLLSRGLRLAEQIESRRDLRRLHMLLGQRALDLGRYADSYNHYEKALQYIDEGAPDQALALRNVATACLYLEKLEDARVYAERACAANPEDLAARGTLGIILQASGQSAEAVAHLEAAAVEGASEDISRALASAYADSGQFDRAVQMLEDAAKHADDADLPVEQARTLRDLGHLYVRAGHLADAIKTWAQAVALYEDNSHHAQAARLLCDIGGARVQLGHTSRAYRDYEQALMLLSSADDPATRGVVLSNAATMYVDRGDLETAEAFFSEAIKIAQQTGDTRAEATRRGNLGWFLLQTGRYERAKNAINYALELSERLKMDLAVAVQTSNLAQAAAAMGDNEAADQLHRTGLERGAAVDSPRWMSVLHGQYAAFLVAMDRGDEAVEHARIAKQLAADSGDLDAQQRAAIEVARAEGLSDPVAARAKLAPAVAHMRTSAQKRVLADALAVSSELSGSVGEMAQAQAEWDEAVKLYHLVGHPAREHSPHWLADQSTG